jgi:hypothetical protein
MHPTPIDSNTLAFVSYDLGQRVLDLEFRRGAVYRYFDVPPSIHDALLAADSKGRFFNRHIRNHFRCQQLR